MYRFIKKNQKKLIAIFGVGLMIVFLLPVGIEQIFGTLGDPVVGQMGDTRIRDSEFGRATFEWELLKRIQIERTFAGENDTPQRGLISILALLGVPAFEEIDRHPEMWLLLQREAQEMGVQVSVDQLENLQRIVTVPPSADPDFDLRVRQALHGFLMVQGAYQRAASTIKISGPLQQHELARQWQAISVDLVEFAAEQFEDQVPAPTEQQLQEHFRRYADVAPGQADQQTNPFGFGYRYPDRATLHYITIPRDQVRQTARQQRSDYEWEVEARRYYRQRESEFQVEVTDEQETPPFTLDPMQPQPQAEQPEPRFRTLPFDEVRDQIMDRILQPQTDRLATMIQNRISGIMAADYSAWQQATTRADQPAAAAPESSLGPPYHTYEYLQQLAALIQDEFNVLPTTAAIEDEHRSEQELADLPGIGQAWYGDLDFPAYATSYARPFAPAETELEQTVLNLYEPSPPLRDVERNVHFFRLTDARPAGPPAELDEVRRQVEADWRLARTYQLAHDAATQLLQEARQLGLEPAADDAEREVIRTEPFHNFEAAVVNGYALPPAANRSFIHQAFELLSQPRRNDRPPVALVELPRHGRAVVAQVNEVLQDWDEQAAPLIHAIVHQQLADRLASELHAQWFSRDAVFARMNFRPIDRRVPDEPAPAAPPRQPFGL